MACTIYSVILTVHFLFYDEHIFLFKKMLRLAVAGVFPGGRAHINLSSYFLFRSFRVSNNSGSDITNDSTRTFGSWLASLAFVICSVGLSELLDHLRDESSCYSLIFDLTDDKSDIVYFWLAIIAQQQHDYFSCRPVQLQVVKIFSCFLHSHSPMTQSVHTHNIKHKTVFSWSTPPTKSLFPYIWTTL